MKILTHDDFSQIQTWVYRHARPLELARFRYHFGELSARTSDASSQTPSSGQDEACRQRYRGEFLRLMTAYRNGDGGFGNALEPDSWNPDSTPYTTLKALELLDEMALLNEPVAQSLIQDVLAYLEACPFATGDGWPFNIPSNDAHPHAPWWTYDPNANVYESIGITTGLCAYILRLAQPESSLYQKALALTIRMLGDFITIREFGEMGLGGFAQLLATLREMRLSETVCASLSTVKGTSITEASLMSDLKARIHASLETDTTLWMYHKPRPSRYIREPESPWLPGMEALTNTELDYLIETRPQNDVWPIDWSWFDLNDRYPKAFAISETWWKSWGAVEQLLFLRAFGRLE